MLPVNFGRGDLLPAYPDNEDWRVKHLSSGPYAKDIVLTLNPTDCERAMTCRNFPAILSSPRLFWTAFCIASVNPKANDQAFNVTTQWNQLKIIGREHIIKNVQESVEAIRELLFKGLTNRSNLIIDCLPYGYDDVFLREASEKHSFCDWSNKQDVKIFKSWFRDYISPALPPLGALIGAVIQNKKAVKHIQAKDTNGTIEIDTFHVEWLKDAHLVFPIPPKAIPSREPIDAALFKLFKSQTYCDLTILARDGELGVHGVVLFLHGGDVIRSMLTHNMKEKNERKIAFEQFSLKAVEAFMDFLYLGPEGLDAVRVEAKGINLEELLELAQTYQNAPFIDVCCNLLTLFYGVAEIERIAHFANLYDHPHLKAYLKHLEAEGCINKPGSIKV